MGTFLELPSRHLSVLNAQIINDRNQWEFDFLRSECRKLELEDYYRAYMMRLRMTYLPLFIIIHAFIMCMHSMLLLATVQDLSYVFTDISIYICTVPIVWLILSINFREWITKRFAATACITSWLTVTFLVLSDISVPIYHKTTNDDIVLPYFMCYVLYTVYMFMPLHTHRSTFFLGIATTTAYLATYAFCVLCRRTDFGYSINTNRLVSEAIFMVLINILGLHYCKVMEMVIRITIIDRRLCIEQNLLLRYARDQEKNLLLSIIPAQIANRIEQDVKARIEQMRKSFDKTSTVDTIGERVNRRTLLIEPHDDVSVLYADVVNYTNLTTQLDVKTLVATIHDLFVKFDIAAVENNVLRIKFLGDCYYCAAGVPTPNPLHAKCCVELGLRMIKDIRDVSLKRKLNIDMRIGVHSGNILSGVIGSCKWQYDIWSKDVDIASRLEATGMAGRVHVSEQTLKLLDGQYIYEEGTAEARDDAILKKYRIVTYLIKSRILESQYSMTSNYASHDSIRHKTEPTPLWHKTVIRQDEIRKQVMTEMSQELEKMPIFRVELSKLCFGRSKRLTQLEMEEQTFRSHITSLCLFFWDWKWEMMFLNEPDHMFKYSVFYGLVTYLAIASIQVVNQRQPVTFFVIGGITIVVLLLVVAASWYKKFWILYVSDVRQPTKNYSLYFYNLSDRIQAFIVARVTIYLWMILMFCICIILQLLECDRQQIENEEIDILLFNDGNRSHTCFNTWGVTESFILVLCMTFLFSRVPFVMKVAVGTVIVGAYTIIVMFEYDFIYERSESTNVGLYPEYSHILTLMLTLAIFHLMDRQKEFISKVDFNWKRQLLKKKDDAKLANETISILINNLLPSHVVDIYMKKRMRNELYYEEYENVAVMFATIGNYDKEKVGLRVLNEIICDFDEVLNLYTGIFKIEKIKVAGWTYMAACGLAIKRSETIEGHFSNRVVSSAISSSDEDMDEEDRKTRAAAATKAGSSKSADSVPLHTLGTSGSKEYRKRPLSAVDSNSIVFVLTQFARDLMRAMHAFNMENLRYENAESDKGMLSIGISSGEVMAGVVGSYKPHYDIWGNAVNMASRMDSTGELGSIQVTEEAANALSKYNVKSTYRGLTRVKGRGLVPTYFVDLDKSLNDINFVMIDPDMEVEFPEI